IGAGVSLPGILAAKCGAEVILSDSSELPHCLEICRQSCWMNNLPQVDVIGLTWGHISQDLLAVPPQDIILASDVFFEPEGLSVGLPGGELTVPGRCPPAERSQNVPGIQ
uniref:Major facilitator superfamily domain containing 11 n=1 Tax=Cavia porcellus TaxID=10141 RepID=H0V2P4_CAVPO